VERLTTALQEHLAEDQADFARALARRCARDEPDAVEEVEKILPSASEDVSELGLLSFSLTPSKPNMYSIRSAARSHKACEIVQEYRRRKPDAVNFIRALLANAGKSTDDLMANAFVEKLEEIERIDRLMAIAESRRNAVLREIERRHALLGEALRRGVEEVEDAEFEEIETTAPKGKKAA
jgi:hypothetical protein